MLYGPPLATAVVFQLVEYGDVVSSAPAGDPFTKNWTPATPTLSEALADSVTVPETVAPFDGAVTDTVGGVVSAINGAKGEFVGAASGTTSQAPGSVASLPDVASASGTSSTLGVTGAAAFIVLNDVDAFQLVVPFEESDAAKIKPNQLVDITVDAVPGLTVPGTVLAVSAEVGRTVEEGDVLGVMEAMKMELTLRAPVTGRVASVAVSTGDQVALGADLFLVEPATDERDG